MDGRSLRPSEVLSTPLSMPELPTDCGDWLADLAPLSQACLGSPAGSPLKGGEREAAEHHHPSSLCLLHQTTLQKKQLLAPQGSFAIKTSVKTAKSNEPPQEGLPQSPVTLQTHMNLEKACAWDVTVIHWQPLPRVPYPKGAKAGCSKHGVNPSKEDHTEVSLTWIVHWSQQPSL